MVSSTTPKLGPRWPPLIDRTVMRRSRISAASFSRSERESLRNCSGESIPSSMLAIFSVNLRVQPAQFGLTLPVSGFSDGPFGTVTPYVLIPLFSHEADAFSFGNRNVTVHGQVRESFGASAGLGPLDFQPVELRGGTDAQNLAHVVRGKIAAAAVLQARALDPAGRP